MNSFFIVEISLDYMSWNMIKTSLFGDIDKNYKFDIHIDTVYEHSTNGICHCVG